jgi:hypothetical protein
MEGASDAAAPTAAMPAAPTTVLRDIGGLLSAAIRNSVCLTHINPRRRLSFRSAFVFCGSTVGWRT